MITDENKIAIVTGTSSGIGLSTAVLLAHSGFTVVATMRDLTKSGALEERAEATDTSLDIRMLDVQDEQSIDTCVRSVMETYGQVDVLVNNAGAGLLGSLEQTPFADLERAMDVNFYGVWRVTQAIFPIMRAAGSGRIVTLSSVGGLIGQPFNDAYCAAKFAVEGFMESLAPVAKRLGVHVSLIEPGPVNTEFVASVLRGVSESEPDVQAVYGPMIETYFSAMQQAFASNGQTGDDIAKVILEAATTASPHLRYTTSRMIRGLISKKYVDPTGDSVIELTGARLP